MRADYWLSAHFRASEFGLLDRPGETFQCDRDVAARNTKALCVLLEWFRVSAGPLRVTSGWRSLTQNASIPGASPTSDHLIGAAADVVPAALDTAGDRVAAAHIAFSPWLSTTRDMPPWTQVIYEYSADGGFSHMHIALDLMCPYERGLLERRWVAGKCCYSEYRSPFGAKGRRVKTQA